MFTCSKLYADLPFAHRQHNHKGHCAFIHGHNWSFLFIFACTKRDENGFVIDFGDLKWLKEWLGHHFDHTLVLNQDDPMLDYLRHSIGDQTDRWPRPLADIRIVPNAGAEGLAEFIFEMVNAMVMAKTEDRVFLHEVTVFEDSKNSANYSPNMGCSHV